MAIEKIMDCDGYFNMVKIFFQALELPECDEIT
jgi:hypothetical protein